MGNNLCFSNCGFSKRRIEIESISSKSKALYDTFGEPEPDEPYFHGYQEKRQEYDNSRFMKYKIPLSSNVNNKYFHPIATNREFAKLLTLHTLPVLSNKKAYQEKISEFTDELKTNFHEKEKYRSLLQKKQDQVKIDETGSTQPHDYGSMEINQSDSLVIEVISAWNRNNSQRTRKCSPIVEIQKYTNDLDASDESYLFDSRQYIEEDDQYIWSKACKIKFGSNTNNTHKNIKISLFKKESGKARTQIGSSYTISVLSTLNNQDVNFKTFEFGPEGQEWNVFTRIQYIYKKETLYKQIIVRLDERQEMLKEIIDRYKEQREQKNLCMYYTFKKHWSGSNLEPNMSKNSSNYLGVKTPSQYAGYYSSTKSLSNERSLNTLNG
ncbi:unnamed protein product [Moneuplotes crassus]|uniref:Uncharacterized protein n=1 Tax=Euplotes crassus TaxID=5936 RepID=A0AAD1U814_EUPCR|nr:unnamed protein product [Moneuplotes crassus]